MRPTLAELPLVQAGIPHGNVIAFGVLSERAALLERNAIEPPV